MKQAPILIIGAMQTEIEFLIRKMENGKEIDIANYHFYEGLVSSYPVVIAKSEVGTIHAAATTTLAIEKYNPVCIINQGTAGSITKNIHKKDIVIGTEILHIMSAKTPFQEEGKGSDSTKWDYITFVADETDKKVTQKADKNLVSFFEQLKNEYKQGKVYTGVIGSGDIWDREIDRMLYLNRQHQILCEDMESISVYTIANQYKTPVVGVRIISNNELLEESYDGEVGKICQEFIYKAIKKLIAKINNRG